MNDNDLIKKFIVEIDGEINKLSISHGILIEEKTKQKTEKDISVYETMINTNKTAKKIWMEQKENLEKQLKQL